jgi:hypothetical protein
MKKICLATIALCASCVLPSDIAELRQAQGDLAAATAADLRELELGVITRAEFDARQAELQARQEAKVREVEDRVEARTEAAVAAATPAPITGNPAVDILLGLAGTALATGVGVNRMRDHRRAMRGEPTTKQAAQKQAPIMP